MEEQKESQLKIKELENKNKILKLQNLDVNNYVMWKWEEILRWILNLESDRFKKYEQDLRKNLGVEQPSGSDLEYVNEGDIRRWGITKFGDIKIVCSKIKDLVKQNGNANKDNNDNDDIAVVAKEEGAISGGYYR